MKRFIVSLLLVPLIAFGQANRPMTGDANYNVTPAQINGHPPNLPVGSMVNGVPIGGATFTPDAPLSLTLTNHLQISLANGSTDGYLSSTDWNTFNGKQNHSSNLDTWSGKTPYSGTLTITTGKTFNVTNTLTLSGTDSSTLNIGGGGTLGSAAFTNTSAYEVPLTFSQSLSRATNTVTLTNDSSSPGNSKYYGTDSGGTKGYFTLPASSSVSVGKSLYVDGTNGNDGTGTRGRFDKPFLTVSAAVAAASSGDTVYVGPGTFTEASPLQLPDGVSLIGVGIDLTKLSGVSDSTHAALAFGSGSLVQDLTVDYSSGGNTFPIGCLSANTAFTSAMAVRVKVTGSSDAFYFDKSGATGFIAFDCITVVSTTGSSVDSIITLGSTGTFDFYNCILSSNTTSLASRGITTNAGTVRFFGGRITVTGATSNIGANCAGGTLELHNVRINKDSSGNDIQRSAGTLRINNLVRDDGAALTTSGTFTDLSRYLTRDNNLSDLANTATARSNLGLVIGTNVEAWDADLDTWATITPASGIGTFLATPSSANLAAAVTNETGSGLLVFATSPTLTTPILGTPTSGTLTNCTGYTDANLSTSDITTNNVSTTKHGFAPKAPNDATKYLDGTGAYSVPAGSGGGTTVKVSGSNFSTSSLSLVDVTGLTFAASANSTYEVDVLLTGQSTTAQGGQFCITYSAVGATGGYMLMAQTTSTAASTLGNILGSASAAGVWTQASTNQPCWIKTFITTGANAGNIKVQCAKLTSGTLTVNIGSRMTVTQL